MKNLLIALPINHSLETTRPTRGHNEALIPPLPGMEP